MSNPTSAEICSSGGQSYHNPSSIDTEFESNDNSSVVDIILSVVTTSISDESILSDSSITAGTNTNVENHIQIATTKETQGWAYFLAYKILCFNRCTTDHHQDMIPTLIQVYGTTDPSAIPLPNMQTTCPWDSKSFQAGTETIFLVLEADRFLSPNVYNLTQDVANLLFCGIVKGGQYRCIELLSFMQKQWQVAKHITQTTYFNINSVLAFPTILALAQRGIKVTF
ncbi:hypothetical protein L873DRAFT_1794154 [Choiromyces venosus 120613-1]|uniref:Uncharacterized protein n=1 Tax=Choiromyces venosus 120613-1 TaxID=1336337 RepID=A0A3N4J684_9PEZI|nr:hypothetical protein L873DRAFT_1794154 [Choiromyces venosus 120613-1]